MTKGRTGTWELDLSTGNLETSIGFHQLFGLAPEEPLPLSRLESLLHAKDWTLLRRALDRCILMRTDLNIELPVPPHDGTIRWVKLQAEHGRASDGSARLVGVAIDATQRINDQEEMHRTALLLRAVLETAPGLIYAKDLDGRMLMANSSTLELIGRAWKETRGRTDLEILPDPAQAAAVMANDRRIMDSGLPEVLEESVALPDAPARTYLSMKAPMRDEAGNIIGLVGVSQDITARKQAERKLLELNETLEARVAERTRERDSAWNRSQDLLIVLDGKGIFKAVNPAWTTLLGWERDELIDHNILEFILPQDHDGTLGALAHAESALLAKYQNRYRHKDGSFRWIEWSAGPDGDRVHASGRDITVQKQAELALEERTAQLESSNKELESFTYSISHDLRAPLRAIDGFGMILEEDYAQKLDDEGRRLLTNMRENSRRMGQLIDALLAFSRLGHTPLAAAPVDVDSLVREVIQEIAPGSATSCSSFQVERLLMAYGDRGLLHQVWINLLSNAKKYSANESAPLIQVRSRIEGAEVIYSIRDNGVGFDMRYADKLFGVFQRLHNADEFSGTGVGLAIVKRIVTRHGGRIWATSVPKEGAEFSFSLPAKVSGTG